MILWWIIFGVFIFAMLALDLGVFNRKVHVIKMKESLLWTAFWVTLALLFCAGIYFFTRRSDHSGERRGRHRQNQYRFL